MKIKHSKFKAGWWLLLPAGFLSIGCTEIFYYSQWSNPASTYNEPVPIETAKENRATLYRIDCTGGVICFGPDEEKTSQKDGLVMKDCFWKSAPDKNGQPSLVWLTFSKRGEGCWQLHQGRKEDSKDAPLNRPEAPNKSTDK